MDGSGRKQQQRQVLEFELCALTACYGCTGNYIGPELDDSEDEDSEQEAEEEEQVRSGVNPSPRAPQDLRERNAQASRVALCTRHRCSCV